MDFAFLGLEDGTYRIRIESVEEGIAHGTLYDEEGEAGSIRLPAQKLEQELEREGLFREGQYFNLVLMENGKKYEIIEIV